MNIYIVTEGKAERKVYKHWIPFVNPKLSFVDEIDKVQNNNFFLISGGGYPAYFEVIEAAISDVNSYKTFDRLVISIDSEEISREEKQDEIKKFLSTKKCRVEIKIIVQHFCLETWGIGNQSIFRKNPQSVRLKEYREHYDVKTQDPELLPDYPREFLNRSQYATKYLKVALNDLHPNLSYSKRNPIALTNAKYFEQIKNRYEIVNHINSFSSFLTAFV